MYLVGSAASAAWAFDLSLGFLNTAVDELRSQGRLGLLVQALVAQSWAAVHLAREPLAVSAADEAARLARETGELKWASVAHLAQAMIAAERGDFERAETPAREADASSIPTSASRLFALAQFVRGRGAVAHQRYSEGFDYLSRMLDPADRLPPVRRRVGPFGPGRGSCPYRPEGRGRDIPCAAGVAGDDYVEFAAAGGCGYPRPLVADDDTAEALYQRALERDLVMWQCFRGRMLLWYGRWLRRQRRVGESRVPLRAAREGFNALAFPTMAECARQELRASGESSGPRFLEAWDQLTPQELQIAQMAAEGLSNREIGRQLFLSHRTVGAHLYRIFPKLSITSRAQIGRALSGVVASTVPQAQPA